MKHICKCGETYPTEHELRMHIGLLTPRWPAVMCDPEHYDPSNPAHVEYVSKPRKPMYQCSCGMGFDYHHHLKNHIGRFILLDDNKDKHTGVPQ